MKSAYTFDELIKIRKDLMAEIKRLKQENAELKKQLGLALGEAVTSIYLNDNSDYLSALWDIVRILNPEAAELLESNEDMAVDKYGGLEGK